MVRFVLKLFDGLGIGKGKLNLVLKLWRLYWMFVFKMLNWGFLNVRFKLFSVICEFKNVIGIFLSN